ncbi:MAG: mechanosensitive ion channel family protein, partial [Phycisphaerales bacterium]
MSPMHHRLRWLYALLFALAATFSASNVFAQNEGSGAPESQDTADEGGADATTASQWVEFIENLLPEWLVENSFVTVKIWQWIGLGSLVLLGMALDLFLRVVLSGITRRAVKRRGGETSDETLAKTVRPFGLLAAGSLWLFALPLLELPTGAADILLAAVSLFVTLAGVWSAYRVTDLLSEFFTSKAELTATKVDDLLIPLLRKTAKIFVTAFGLIYIAKALTIDIGPLLAGLGIGGIGFAFAARDTLENFFGSVTVIIDRPF